MGVNDRLTIPLDVQMHPVRAYAQDVRARLESRDEDVAISRVHSRTPSLIVDQDAADFLQQFRKPQTIIEAVVAFSRTRQRDPEQTLDEVFPLLQRLRRARFLVEENSEARDRIEPAFDIGAVIGQSVVLECVHVLEDTEVYKVAAPGGGQQALKIARPGAEERNEDIQREAAILRYLGGVNAPALRNEGMYARRSYFLMDWCNGHNLSDTADKLRGLVYVPTMRSQLIDLCCSVLDAYAQLHACGIIHGDVHPGNILIDEVGRVTILDFALARSTARELRIAEPRRGGMAYYFEPEYARAYRQHSGFPPASPEGEQYALAVLVYLVLVGAHYLNFALGRQEAFRQIAEDMPLSFEDRGLESWPAVEAVLARALSKDAESRFPSVADFAYFMRSAERDLDTAVRQEGTRYNVGPRPTSFGEEFLHTTLERLGPDSRDLAQGLAFSPRCSLNFGAAGVAYLFYRVGCLQDSAPLLATADRWAERALADAEDDTAFHNRNLGLTPDVVGPVSPYHTEAGVHCVRALVAQARGDFASTRAAITSFVRASERSCTSLDLALGRAGTLLACAILLEATSGNEIVDVSPLIQLGNTTLQDILGLLDGYTSVESCVEIPYLGVAHGWAGILYSVLRWSVSSGYRLPTRIEGRLEELAACGIGAQQGIGWPRRNTAQASSKQIWAGWCHGSAGHVFLWSLAQQMHDSHLWLDLAVGAGLHTWKDTTERTGTLCCGHAGQAYALLNLFRCTGDSIWLDRARTMGEKALRRTRTPQWRDSLYKGEVGLALLVADLSQPEWACMPFFESEGWPAR